MYKRRVHKHVTKGKSVSSHFGKIDGFGYIIIPNDLPRDEYIRDVYLKGYCMILTSYNEPLRDVLIPRSLLQELVFPASPERRGSLIRYSIHNEQICLESIHLRPEESYMYEEDTYADVRVRDSITMSDIKSLNGSNWLISFDDQDSNNGQITITSKGVDDQTTIKLGLDGTLDISSSDSYSIRSTNKISESTKDKEVTASTSFEVKIGADDEFNTLIIDNDSLSYVDKFENKISVEDGRVIVESDNIELGGGATEKALLGNKTIKELNKINMAIQTIINAIRTSPVSPSDGGSLFKTSLINHISSIQAATFDKILSDKVALK